MRYSCPTLIGTHVRLEPLGLEHVEGLAAASALDPSLYEWSAVPQGVEAVGRYVESTLAQRDAGTAVPFATVRMADNTVVGCTRFFDLERWAWPAGHPRAALTTPDVGEIGGTWLSASAVRTAANTEAKLLMLTHAFEIWDMLRICFHTDARNDRSAAAIERIGGHFEGILRAHRLAVDYIARDSKRYSITANEWPEIKAHLQHLLASHAASTT